MSEPGENEREASGFLDVLRHVVDTLREMEERGEGSGTVSGPGRFRTDYGFSARTGARPDPDSLWERLGAEGAGERGTAGGRDGIDAGDEDHLVDVRADDDGVTVLADLPRATAESVTAGIDDRNRLVIGIDDEVVERIPLDDADILAADTTFRNGVLEVRLRYDVEETDE